MKYLVTGANGFLGKHLCDYLDRHGIEHRDVVRSGHGKQFSTGDLTKFSNWKDLFAGVQIIVHAAAKAHDMSKPQDLEKIYNSVNFEMTVKLAQQAKLHGAKKFIFISTIKVNGESTVDRPFTADDTPQPLDPYGVSKYRAEQAILKLNEPGVFEVTVIRPCLVYGAGVKANFKSLINIAKKGIPLPFGLVNNKRSIVSVDNLIDLIMTCANTPKSAGQVFLVSDGVDLSLPELIEAIAGSYDKKALMLPVPPLLMHLCFALLGRRDFGQRLFSNLQVDISKNKTVLGWEPPFSIAHALAKMTKGT
ncbi:MAG: NAD-dependent epimerase/dehydratase family protein [Bdellovibrio sp.]|nr:NAD-dependent epimerase/dehydratase family protein [Bdellovibrio sp.]